MKRGAKRRRTKKEILTEKQDEAKKKAEIEMKLAEHAAMREQLN